ncbi:MAG: YlxR family protein [Aerococcus sp.]|nr:YlxR family protein [Aerococcus sp.]
MKKRKIPMRKCVVTGKQYPKQELVRIVRTPDQEVAIDPTGKMNGRGAYIVMEPDVVRISQKKHILDRHLKVQISDDFYQELYEYVDHQKARKEIMP